MLLAVPYGLHQVIEAGKGEAQCSLLSWTCCMQHNQVSECHCGMLNVQRCNSQAAVMQRENLTKRCKWLPLLC